MIYNWKLDQSLVSESANRLQNFHDKFKSRDKQIDQFTKSFEIINSSKINDRLRTRPIQNKIMMPIQNSDYAQPMIIDKVIIVEYKFHLFKIWNNLI